MNREPTIVVAIAGASASGKSRLAENLKSAIEAEIPSHRRTCGILSEDAYYRCQDHLSMPQRRQTNYDHPDAIDQELLIQHLDSLKQGRPVDVPVYDYDTHNRTGETKAIGPSDILIVEGILLLHRDAMRPLYDLSLFVDVAIEICLERRIERDFVQRKRDEESVQKQFAETVEPMYRQFVLPSKSHADIIVPRGGDNEAAVTVLANHLLRSASKLATD